MSGRVLAWLCGAALIAALSACGAGAGAGSDADGATFAASSSRRGADCTRPYSDDSPWNRPIGRVRARPAGLPERLTSDPSQYTYPVYEVTSRTPLQTVRFDGWYSRVFAGGKRLVNVRGGSRSDEVARVPIPAHAQAADGSDAQVIVVNRDTGEEWDMSNVTRRSDGTYDVLNVGRYHTTWSAVPPLDEDRNPYFLRGAKIPYLAGLVRPCEIARGRIDHALAFAYPHTTPRWVYPATHSDGRTPVGQGLPTGTRLQLDPSISAATIRRRWRCTGACFTIARALQRYGMYLIDSSGRSKLIMEYEGTANWNGAVTASTPSRIPVDRIRVVPPPSRKARR
jgi:hypothetical protein